MRGSHSIDGPSQGHGTLPGDSLRKARGGIRFQPADSKTGLSKHIWELRHFDPEQLAIFAHLGSCDSTQVVDTSKVVVVDRSGYASKSRCSVHSPLVLTTLCAVAQQDLFSTKRLLMLCRSTSNSAPEIHR
jgi:hypothetical protein